jgi:hypothetical protein
MYPDLAQPTESTWRLQVLCISLCYFRISAIFGISALPPARSTPAEVSEEEVRIYWEYYLYRLNELRSKLSRGIF